MKTKKCGHLLPRCHNQSGNTKGSHANEQLNHLATIDSTTRLQGAAGTPPMHINTPLTSTEREQQQQNEVIATQCKLMHANTNCVSDPSCPDHQVPVAEHPVLATAFVQFLKTRNNKKAVKVFKNQLKVVVNKQARSVNHPDSDAQFTVHLTDSVMSTKLCDFLWCHSLPIPHPEKIKDEICLLHFTQTRTNNVERKARVEKEITMFRKENAKEEATKVDKSPPLCAIKQTSKIGTTSKQQWQTNGNLTTPCLPCFDNVCPKFGMAWRAH